MEAGIVFVVVIVVVLTSLKVQMLLLDCFIMRSFVLEWFAMTVILFHNSLCERCVY